MRPTRLILLVAAGVCFQGIACGQSNSDKSNDELVREFYSKVALRNSRQECKAIAEEMHARGVKSNDRTLQARGLMRLAYCEIRYHSWGNKFRDKLRECESICRDQGTLEYAELLLFRGHMGKWRPRKLSQGISDLRTAILIASQIRDDILLAECHLRLADLVMLEGHSAVCRSHALHALTIAEHHGYESAVAYSLYLLASAFGHDGHTELELQYAQRLLELRPTDRFANQVVSQALKPEEFIRQERQILKEVPESGRKVTELDSMAFSHMLIGQALLRQGKAEEARESFILASQLFKKTGNDSNYIEMMIRSYMCRVDNNIPIKDSEAFLKMIQMPALEHIPSNLQGIARILEAMGRHELASHWRKRHRLVEYGTMITEHERAKEAANQRLNLELARRHLEEEVKAKQKSAWFYRIGLSGMFLLFAFSLLGFHLIGNRKAIAKLKQEVDVRKAAQAKNEELAQQLLQTQKLDALGTLSAGIAHDFNNTLQAVTLLAEAVKQEGDADFADNHHLNTILEVTQQGSTLTRGMLVFSGNHEARKTSQDLVALVKETEAMVKPMVPASIDISLQVGNTSESMIVNMDGAQIKQLLLNLVINAKDAMPEGGKLTIRVRQSDRQPSKALLIVSDTGEGMQDEVRTRIFEPFFTTKDRGHGTGLGLSMVHGIIEDHGGSIDVESKAGGGTTVTISLPTVNTYRSENSEPLQRPRPLERGCALLVEDNQYIRLGIRTRLERLGFHVYEAEDGLNALEVYDGMSNKPHLILMDVDLPQLDGQRTLAALRDKGALAPAIFMTGLSTNNIDGPVLAKPFSEDDLINAIVDVQKAATAVAT